MLVTMALRRLMRCLMGQRLKSMECVVWMMSTTAVIFLVYSLGKLQSQYLIESSVMVKPKDADGHHVLSLVKLYEKAGLSPVDIDNGDVGDAVENDAEDAVYKRRRRDSRIRKLLKNVERYIPLSEQEDQTIGEWDELDGYNYFMVSEEEAAVQKQHEEAAARRAHRIRQKGHAGGEYHTLGLGPMGSDSGRTAKKRHGWVDHPPNVEFHTELKQDFKEYNAKSLQSFNSALKLPDEEADNKNGLKFLYIDDHGNKVYGSSFKKKKKKQFEPLQINVNRGVNVAQFDQGDIDKGLPAKDLKKNSNDIIRQYVEQNMKRRKKEEEKHGFKTLQLYVTTSGRFGNHLFQYASLYGLARATNRIPVLPKGTELSEVFVRSRFSIAEGTAPRDITMVHETNSGVYTPMLYNLPPEDVLVCCYLQSWRYFNNYRTMIKHLFRFKRPIRDHAAELLDDALDIYTRKNPDMYSGQSVPHVTYIATHVRRGDYMLKEHLDRGYRPAPLAYLRRAMEYYRSKYAHALFVVTSDDLSWSVQHLNQSDVAFVSGPDQGVDLATLAMCNHTIMTVGTYGWWAGWLAGGEVVYYRDWIAPESNMAQRYNAQDYFPPNWRGLGDQL